MGRGSTLAPCGLVVERIETAAERLLIVARSVSGTAVCPACGKLSARVHSKYRRVLSDLPSQGRSVRILIWARRFRCILPDCRQRIFAERLAATKSRPFARRTTRLGSIVHHLGLALGGRPGQSFARRILLPVSNDTLLRVVRRAELRQHAGWLRREKENTAITALAQQGVAIKEIVRRTGHSRGLVR